MSTHIISSGSFDSKFSCYLFLIHGYSLHLVSSSFFTPDSVPKFPDTRPWLSPIFNFLKFSLFTVDTLSLSQTSPSSSILFHQPLLQIYIKHTAPLDLQLDTSFINPHHSIPELQLVSSDNCFNGWFDIPLIDESHITHIRSPKPYEILSLYRLYHFIPLYPSLLSAPIIRHLVLNILPSCLAQQFSIILLSLHQSHSASHSHNKWINYCFHLHPIPSSLSWKKTYTSDKETSLLLYHFSFIINPSGRMFYHLFQHSIVALLKIIH